MLTEHDDDGRLIAGEPEAINILATYTTASGWTAQIAVRRQFQAWSQAAHGTYYQLSTPELVTLLDATLCAELKI